MTISPRRLSIAFIAPFLIAALSTTGCGGSSGSKTGAAPKVDACRLFTEMDAAAVAGETLASMNSTFDQAKGRNPLECIYNSGSIDQPRILSLLVREHGSAGAAKDFQESSRSTLESISGGQARDVPGLGNGALWVGGRIQQLHVLAGSRQLVITVQSPDGADQLPRARQIATRALERLRVPPG